MTLRTRKGTKGPENRKPHPPNQLVRMRSPVQIRIAAPQKPLFLVKKGGFTLLFVLFGFLKICGQGFDHRTSHRQKKSRFRRCYSAGALCFFGVATFHVYFQITNRNRSYPISTYRVICYNGYHERLCFYGSSCSHRISGICMHLDFISRRWEMFDVRN